MTRAGIHCQPHLLNVSSLVTQFESFRLTMLFDDSVLMAQRSWVRVSSWVFVICRLAPTFSHNPKICRLGRALDPMQLHTWACVRLFVSGCQSYDKPVTWLSTPLNSQCQLGWLSAPITLPRRSSDRWCMVGFSCSCDDDLETQWNWSRLLGLIGSGGMKLCLLSVLLLCFTAVSYTSRLSCCIL